MLLKRRKMEAETEIKSLMPLSYQKKKEIDVLKCLNIVTLWLQRTGMALENHNYDVSKQSIKDKKDDSLWYGHPPSLYEAHFLTILYHSL